MCRLCPLAAAGVQVKAVGEGAPAPFGRRLGPLGAAHPQAPWDRSRLGTSYPGMPWEPKQSFGAVADFYATHTAPAA